MMVLKKHAHNSWKIASVIRNEVVKPPEVKAVKPEQGGIIRGIPVR
jgi:hypothetical protein